MSSLGPLVLFTDFGLAGPYVGQMKAAIHRVAPHAVVMDLCHDLAPFAPRPAAYLLAALLPYLPVGACVVAVVDPGVGTARRGLVLEGSGMRLIGPDNG
ncbi:MAG: SAM-dependent chlorinase/fluorinase, partial [Candidatus Macondimonas sp.]